MSFPYLVKKPQDLDKINTREIGELLWWSYNLGITPEKLLTAIDEVGDLTEQVKRYIQQEQT